MTDADLDAALARVTGWHECMVAGWAYWRKPGIDGLHPKPPSHSSPEQVCAAMEVLAQVGVIVHLDTARGHYHR